MDSLKGRLILYTYANDMAIDAIMMQEGKEIAFEFKKLNNIELNYSVYEK